MHRVIPASASYMPLLISRMGIMFFVLYTPPILFIENKAIRFILDETSLEDHM